jgi:hypothetical protein
MAANLPPWLPQAVRDDPKKAGVLTVLIAVLLVVGGRTLMGSAAPAAAQAAPAKPKPDKLGKPAKPAAPAAVSRMDIAWLKAPIDPVSRNLFAIRVEHFPHADGRSENAPKAEAATFWESVEKSRAQQADKDKRREILVENLKREAAKLQLQSTVMGPDPQAIIGRGVVKVGDTVGGDESGRGLAFRVLAIEPRRVIVEREGIRLELRMQH